MPKKQNPRISIVVPVYNIEKYLEKSLKSISNQTFKDIEIICVNDGSTDNCPNILKKYQQKDKRIKIINQKNKGYGAALNKGLFASKGKYIGIIDPDDYISPKMYEKLFTEMEENNLEVAKANFFMMKKGKEYKFEPSNKLLGKKLFENPAGYPKLFLGHPSMWVGLYKKDFLEKNKIKFVETPGASFQDIPFWFEVLSSCKKIKFLDEYLYYWRIHGKQSSSIKGKTYNFTNIYPKLDERLKEKFSKNKKKYSLLNTIRIMRSLDDYQYGLYEIPFKFKKILFKNAKKDLRKAMQNPFIPEKLSPREKTQLRLIEKEKLLNYIIILWGVYGIRNFFGAIYDSIANQDTKFLRKLYKEN